ncbi:hypothetical protein PT974_06567 [Cladobotryum mycophilum]|uniref:Transmembrane protein UsgS n=1 Tax=Cladobotryum mycophilum TaxID=491253 RepID=A0ABR0SM56_9HYPO
MERQSRVNGPHNGTEKLEKTLDRYVNMDQLRNKFDLSHFNANAVLRGVQLTFVGAHRALQNPKMFTNDHYRQAAAAVLIGIAIRLILSIPIFAVRVVFWFLSFVYPLDAVTWDDAIIDGLNFIGEYVLQIPFFLMTLMRHVVPTLDNLFMQSLQWVDITYVQKHKQDKSDDLRNMYHPNLAMYPTSHKAVDPTSDRGLSSFLRRYSQKGLVSVGVFGLSYLPLIGNFVLPAASFYTFHEAVGLGPASLIFGIGVFLPRQYLVVFLQVYFSSRSLVRELLEPYFTRIKFTKAEKKKWFRSREGVLFGFGLGFYVLIKIPLVGVLIYGIAEASTAYLVTKVTKPPPHPNYEREYAISEQIWTNRHEFLNLSLRNLDRPRHEESLQDS